MAYLSDKEQFFTYKGWPDLTLSLQPGSDEVELTVSCGYAIEISDSEIGVFLQIDAFTGFKNPSEVKQCFVKLSLQAEKKLYRDTVKVSRLEKTIATYFKGLAASKKYFQGTLFISTSSRMMNQFEMGDDSLLKNLFDAALQESDKTFEIPAGGAKKGFNNAVKAETEKEKLTARIEIYRDSMAWPYDDELFSADKTKGMDMLYSEKKQFVARMALFRLMNNCAVHTDDLVKLADYLYDK